jgi:hypothetical protein
MLKKLSAFFVERIKFVDFYGWMYFLGRTTVCLFLKKIKGFKEGGNVKCH